MHLRDLNCSSRQSANTENRDHLSGNKLPNVFQCMKTRSNRISQDSSSLKGKESGRGIRLASGTKTYSANPPSSVTPIRSEPSVQQNSSPERQGPQSAAASGNIDNNTRSNCCAFAVLTRIRQLCRQSRDPECEAKWSSNRHG